MSMHIKYALSNLKTNKGFTLLEVLVGLSLFLLIAVVFTRFMLTCLDYIAQAGDRNILNVERPSEVDKMISKGTAYLGGEVPVRITDSDNTVVYDSAAGDPRIVGGIIGYKDLYVFEPQLPAIRLVELDGSTLDKEVEGYDSRDIKLEAYNIDLSSISNIQLLSEDSSINIGNILNISSPISLTNKDTSDVFVHTAEFELPDKLTNAHGNYVFRVNYEGEPIETKFYVWLPWFVAVGEDELVISTDSSEWKDRLYATTFPLNTPFTLNSIAWGNNNYVAVGNRGLNRVILKSTDIEEWSSISGLSSGELNSIAYHNQLKTFVTVGDDGAIYSSSDGDSWTSRSVSDDLMFDKNLNDVIAFKYGFIAVGEENSMLMSTDGITWNSEVEVLGLSYSSILTGELNNKLPAGMDNSEYNLSSIAVTDDISGLDEDTFRMVLVGDDSFKVTIDFNHSDPSFEIVYYDTEDIDNFDPDGFTGDAFQGNNFNKVRYLNRTFVVVGDSGEVRTSDGVVDEDYEVYEEERMSWNKDDLQVGASSISDNLYDVIYHNNFIVAAENGEIISFYIDYDETTGDFLGFEGEEKTTPTTNSLFGLIRRN